MKKKCTVADISQPLATTLIKGTPSKNVSWPEIIENVEIFPSAGFLCLFSKCSKVLSIFKYNEK